MSERRPQAMSVKTFKALVKNGKRPENVLLIKNHMPERFKVDQHKRQVSTVVSTSAVDRDRDVVKVDGWDLEEYRRNPIVLFAHKSEELPIANALQIGVSNGALKSMMQFPEQGVHPFADTVYGLVKGDFLRTVSAGFRPLEFDPAPDRDGLTFHKQKLIEYSIVPIPSNPDALIEAKSQGIEIGPVIEWCKMLLDTNGLMVVPRDKVEKALAVMDTKRHVFFGLPAQAEPVMLKIAGLLTQEQGEALLESVQQLEEVLAEIGLSSIQDADPMARAEAPGKKDEKLPPAEQAEQQQNPPEEEMEVPDPEAGPEAQPGEGDPNMPEEQQRVPPKKKPAFPFKAAPPAQATVPGGKLPPPQPDEADVEMDEHGNPVMDATTGKPKRKPKTQAAPTPPAKGGTAPPPPAKGMRTKTPPWHVEQRGGKHVVVGDEDGKEYGSHASKEEADAQVAALYANAKMLTKGKTLARVRQRAGKYQVVLSNGEVLDEYDVAENATRAAEAINSAASMADTEHVAPGDEPGKIAPNDVVLKLADGGPVDKDADVVYDLGESSLKDVVAAAVKRSMDEFKQKVLGQLPD